MDNQNTHRFPYWVQFQTSPLPHCYYIQKALSCLIYTVIKGDENEVYELGNKPSIGWKLPSDSSLSAHQHVITRWRNWFCALNSIVLKRARRLPNWGKVLAQHGQRACPGWADLLSDVCPISDYCNTHIPVLQDSANAYDSCRLIPHIRQFLSSANHPDNWLTIARWSTIWLSEYYNKKPDNLTVFWKFLVLLKISDTGNSSSCRSTQINSANELL